jgi:hypothetical protein
MSVAQMVTSQGALGEGSTVLLYTAPVAGVWFTLQVLAGAPVVAGWYNGAQTTIYDVAGTAEGLPAIKFGPLASGDKIFGSSDFGESKYASVKFQFDS